jgi:hypothetical protein
VRCVTVNLSTDIQQQGFLVSNATNDSLLEWPELQQNPILQEYWLWNLIRTLRNHLLLVGTLSGHDVHRLKFQYNVYNEHDVDIIEVPGT